MSELALADDQRHALAASSTVLVDADRRQRCQGIDDAEIIQTVHAAASR